MRPLPFLAAALVLVACGKDRRATSSEPGANSTMRGPDAVLLRVPRGGGAVSAYVYPNLDSAVWRSTESAPALDRVLAFDGEGGQLAALDAKHIPVRIDLRLGTVRRASTAPLALAASLNGIDIYGVADGAVTRLTPAGGDWSVKLPATVQQIEPQRDGAILVAAKRGSGGVVWRIRPPGTKVTDSVIVREATRSIDAQTPERLYFVAGSELSGVQSRTMQPIDAVSLDAPARALAATPSGDRFYAALDGETSLDVIDRYGNAVVRSVELPGAASELRMDPLGRYVLARAAKGDSAWVVTVGTDKVVGSIHTSWRSDLPMVLPDGAIVTVAGNDAQVVDGRTLKPSRTIAGGANDFWHLVIWNGFRPRAKGLDQPVQFDAPQTSDSAALDSAAADSVAHPDSAAKQPPDTNPVPNAEEAESIPRLEAAIASSRGYTVQFAAAGTEREARGILKQLKLPSGLSARIVPGTRSGKTLYRVVVGPFASRREAERVGRGAGHDFWVYEGAP